MSPIVRTLLVSCLLMASTGNAVELGAAHDTGEVLLFPYFTARAHSYDDPVTVLKVSNRGATSAAGEAVAARVAFRVPAVDGTQPPPLLINLLLRADDSLTVAAARGRLHIADDSCAIAAGGVLTRPPGGIPLPGPEGWVEVFELGRVTSTDVLGRLNRTDRVAACAELAALLPTLATKDWLAAPENRLSGTSSFVSVATGSSFSAPPTVLRNFRDEPFYANATQDAPTLADVRPARADVVLAGGSRRTSSFAANPVDAVSAVLMTTQWELDFSISPSLAARTDVVLALPTRRWYVDGARADPPFQHPTRPQGAFELNVEVFDREGERPADARWKCTPAFDVDQLGPVINAPLMRLKFGTESAFYSPDAEPLTYASRDTTGCANGGLLPQILPESGFYDGGVKLQFIDGPRAPKDTAGFGRLISDEGHVFRGIPVIGTAATLFFAFFEQPRVLANYGGEQPIVRRTEY
jgi:hypothetical protein